MLLAQAGGDPRGAPAKAVADLIDLAGRERPGGGLDLPGGVRITRQEGLLILDRADAASRAGGRNLPAPFCVDMPVPGEVTLPDGRGTLRARRLDAAALGRIAETFHDRHRATYGHDNRAEPVQLVSIRLTAVGVIPALAIMKTSPGCVPAGTSRSTEPPSI